MASPNNLDFRSLRMAPQMQLNWQPGPTEQPIGGLAKLADGFGMLAGFGGRTRFEAAALGIFLSLMPTSQGTGDPDDYHNDMRLAVELGWRFVQAIDARLSAEAEAAKKKAAALQAMEDGPGEEVQQQEDSDVGAVVQA